MQNVTLSRRGFLTTATAGVSAATTGFLLHQSKAAVSSKPIFELSLAQWSFHRRLFGRSGPKMDNLEFASASKKLGIDGLEYVNQFFKDKAKDKKYLDQMKQRASDSGVKSILIMIDGEGALGNPNKSERAKAVANHHQWVHAAKYLGCHAIRVNARSDSKLSFTEQQKLAADGLLQLTEYGAKEDISVIVENHGGLSSNGSWLVGVMKLVNHPRCGTLPDFGNFLVDGNKNQWYDRYKGVKEMMPYAKAVSAKSQGFPTDKPWATTDNAGHETDYLKMMRIVLDAGYRGYVGIEFGGDGDEVQGVKKTRDLLIRVREKLAQEYP